MNDKNKKIKLGSIGEFKGGVTGIKPSDYGFGTPFITYKNVFQNFKIDPNMFTLVNVPTNNLEKWSCIYGDIFFTASSETPDEVAMSSVLLHKDIDNLTFNGFCKRFRLNNFDILFPEYAQFLFRSRSFRNSISEVITGDIRFNISQSSLAGIEISLPPLPEQKRISSILSSFDNKIEQLKKENNILEDIAQNIFKEWFVKYNFPNKDGKPYKDNNGKMIDSELGLIPEGWGVDHIGKYINIRGGGTPSTKDSEYWNGDLNWTTPKDLSNLDGLFLFNSGTKITPFGLKQISSGLLPKGTLLLSSRAPIGYLALTEVETAINQGFIAFLPNSYFPNIYIYIWLKRNMKLIEGIANGSTFMEVNKENLRNFEMIIPEKSSLENFECRIMNIFEKISKNEYDVSKFKQMKTALLNNLIINQQ